MNQCLVVSGNDRCIVRSPTIAIALNFPALGCICERGLQAPEILSGRHPHERLRHPGPPSPSKVSSASLPSRRLLVAEDPRELCGNSFPNLPHRCEYVRLELDRAFDRYASKQSGHNIGKQKRPENEESKSLDGIAVLTHNS